MYLGFLKCSMTVSEYIGRLLACLSQIAFCNDKSYRKSQSNLAALTLITLSTLAYFYLHFDQESSWAWDTVFKHQHNQAYHSFFLAFGPLTLSFFISLTRISPLRSWLSPLLWLTIAVLYLETDWPRALFLLAYPIVIIQSLHYFSSFQWKKWEILIILIPFTLFMPWAPELPTVESKVRIFDTNRYLWATAFLLLLEVTRERNLTSLIPGHKSRWRKR